MEEDRQKDDTNHKDLQSPLRHSKDLQSPLKNSAANVLSDSNARSLKAKIIEQVNNY